MPVLGNEHQAGAYGPLLDEVGPRMDAAIAYLKSKGAGPIALVAHSLGATMSASWLAERPNAPIAAYVAIGMPGGGTDPRLDTLAKMGRIRCPMLDLYGQHDLEPVVETAQARVRSALEGGNAGYNQIQVPGADHFFEGEEAALLDSVAGWLDAAVPTQGQSPGQTQAQGAAPQ
jgi:pimeloyl-ACP methyl ester carboxylesterase